jgi:hypothetical protein
VSSLIFLCKSIVCVHRIVVRMQYCPHNDSFHECLSAWNALFVVDYFADIIMMCDNILHAFFYAAVLFEDSVQRVVTDRSEITAMYLRRKMNYVSLATVMPVDLLAVPFGNLCVWRFVKFSILSIAMFIC